MLDQKIFDEIYESLTIFPEEWFYNSKFRNEEKNTIYISSTKNSKIIIQKEYISNTVHTYSKTYYYYLCFTSDNISNNINTLTKIKLEKEQKEWFELAIKLWIIWEIENKQKEYIKNFIKIYNNG